MEIYSDVQAWLNRLSPAQYAVFVFAVTMSIWLGLDVMLGWLNVQNGIAWYSLLQAFVFGTIFALVFYNRIPAVPVRARNQWGRYHPETPIHR